MPLQIQKSILFQFFALIIPLATRIPFDPNSIAFDTSSPDTIPAPQSNSVLFFELLTMLAAFAINSGFSLEIAFPEPINSGGSIAIKSGFKFNIFFNFCNIFYT